jgi:hypothetical protein
MGFTDKVKEAIDEIRGKDGPHVEGKAEELARGV